MVDVPTIEIEAPRCVANGLAAALIESAIKRELEQRRGDLLTWLFLHPALSEEMRQSLLEANPGLLAALGHRLGPPQLLELLAEKYRYPEAILTIARRLYTDPASSAADFEAFLQRHCDDRWMLKSLVPLSASSEEKEKALVACLGRYPDLSNDYIEMQNSRRRQSRASIESSAEVLQELFATRDPAVLRCLALNPHTPESLLQELAAIKEIGGARQIRELANEALRKRTTPRKV
jgi:hypothetical protein